MKRSELYERIWSTPASKIAEELGISGSRVAAVCRRHNVPTPPRGYWAKLGVGKHVPKTPLPQPEADYDLKIGMPATGPTPSAWIAPGVLLRAGRDIPLPQPERQSQPQPELSQAPSPVDRSKPPSLAEVCRQTPPRPRPIPDAAGVDLELVRAAAVELQDIQAIRDLLQAVAARAVHSRPEEAQRVLAWAAAVRVRLEERDPISALIRLNMQA